MLMNVYTWFVVNKIEKYFVTLYIGYYRKKKNINHQCMKKKCHKKNLHGLRKINNYSEYIGTTHNIAACLMIVLRYTLLF